MNLEKILNRTRYQNLIAFLLKTQSRCRICGAKARDTHHIIPLNYKLENEEAVVQLEELHTAGNIIVVCPKCHKRIHGYSGCFKTGNDGRRKLPTKEFLKKMRQKSSEVRKERVKQGLPAYNGRRKAVLPTAYTW